MHIDSVEDKSTTEDHKAELNASIEETTEAGVSQMKNQFDHAIEEKVEFQLQARPSLPELLK